jgi:hypothetical protein
MEYIKRAGGLAADKDYPYCVGTGKDDACYPCNTEDCTESNCGRCLEPPTCNRDKYPCKAGKFAMIVKRKSLKNSLSRRMEST